MALIVAFALGFLLACYLLPHQVLRASCPRPDDHGPLLSMNGSTSGHGSEGRGSPEKIGSPGEGTGHHTGRPNAAPVEGGGGAGGSGGGGDGDLGGGKQWQAHGEEQTFDGKSGPCTDCVRTREENRGWKRIADLRFSTTDLFVRQSWRVVRLYGSDVMDDSRNPARGLCQSGEVVISTAKERSS